MPQSSNGKTSQQISKTSAIAVFVAMEKCDALYKMLCDRFGNISKLRTAQYAIALFVVDGKV
jgi:hypothetical protein